MDFIKTSILVLLVILFLCKGKATSKTQVCLSGLKKCFTSFAQDVAQHETGNQICRDVGVFVHCVLGMDCDLPPERKAQSFELVESQLAKKGLKCDEISKLKASHEKESELGGKETADVRKKESNGPGYSPHFYPETADFFKTTPATGSSKSSFQAPAAAEATSSRRSRTVPRPVSWSNWGPQSHSASSDALRSSFVTGPFSNTFLFRYTFNIVIIFSLVSGLCIERYLSSYYVL